MAVWFAATDEGLVEAAWEMNERRPSLPSQDKTPDTPRKISEGRSSHVDMLVHMALAILVVGCVSMVVGVALVAQNLQSPERGITTKTRLMREDTLDIQQPDTDSEATPKPIVFSSPVQEQCYKERDHGLIEVLRASSQEFCGGIDDSNLTTVTLYNVPGRFKATLFSGLTLDLSGTRVSSPIWSLAGEGGGHDPRFVFTPHMIRCQCPELEQHAQSRQRVEEIDHQLVEVADPLQLWHPALARVDLRRDHPSTICSRERFPESIRSRYMRWWGNRDAQRRIMDPERNPLSVLNITDQVVLVARKDDHNPFFQVSGAFNAWIMMKALDWDPTETQLVHLDEGYPSPIDTLQQKLLGSNRPILSGGELKDKLIHFQSQVMLSPFESDGPMMLDLDNDNPCFNSSLIKDFRLVALEALNVSTITRPHSADQVQNSTQPVIVTVITRRPYGGRRVQRIWRNEGDVLAFMRESYANKSIIFRSVECADLSLQQQMQLMVESDVVMGMHGAGMVNVLWTRPETLVLEIFPWMRKRWGYRNLCQNLGCTYRDFRGGIDISTGQDDNANDKYIPSEEFLAFFDPVLTQHLAAQGRSL